MAEQGTVIHVREMANFPDAVYIGRRNRFYNLAPSLYANRFVIGKDGDRAWVIELYRRFLEPVAMGHTSDFILGLIPLRNRPLACWCRKSDEERTEYNACHGDVLIDFLSRHTDDELRVFAAKKSANHLRRHLIPT